VCGLLDLQLAIGRCDFAPQCGVFILKLGIQRFQLPFLSLCLAVVEPGVLPAKIVGQPCDPEDCSGEGGY